MAYLNFSEPLPTMNAGHDRAAASAAPAVFSPLEWLAIGVGSRDPISTIAAPSPLARALGGLFGLGSSSRLADERLERLRRFAVLVRHHGWRVPTSEVKTFIGEFSVGQLELVIAAVTRAMPGAARRTAA